MEANSAQWTEEQAHLAQTIQVAKTELDALAKRSERRLGEIQAAQEEMLERVTYDMGGLYSAQGFQDLLELTQLSDPISGEAHAQKTDDQAMRSLIRMIGAPYFARIDFLREGDKEPRIVYIGRATLMEKDSLAFHVYDWRTPIASVFYRYGVGPARYEAPAGEVTGEVQLKRQYEIENGELRFFFDADVQIVDQFLRDLLSRPASASMKSIVETIQRDQDAVIRDLTSDLLMVQGSAGSGKTSVALHRVAYLMYQGLADRRLSAEDILILSPNAVFERYISHVLPELGEKQVQTALFEELFQRMLPDIAIQPRSAWAEEWLACRDQRAKDVMRRVRAFKGSKQFMQMLDRLVYELPRRWIPFADVDYAGQRVAIGDLMRVEICNSKKHAPIGIRLQWLEKAIFQRVHALRPKRLEKLWRFASKDTEHAYESREYARALSIAEHAALLHQVRAFSRVDCAGLYRALFADSAAFARLSEGLIPEDDAELIRVATLEGLSDDALLYGDAAAIAYLTARVYGVRAYAHMRQVVVDEVQDQDALHISLLNTLFPKARFTVLGDIHQTVAGTSNPALYEEIRGMLQKSNSMLVTMDKSFRCTKEIFDFSAAFLPPGAVGACFSRSGPTPQVHATSDAAGEDALLIREIEAMQGAGMRAIALLCKTDGDACALHARLKDRIPLRLVRDDGALETGGVFAIPLYAAKGLEFDAVLVCDVDAAHYLDEEDRNLLYIACTRALHRLSLFYAGDASPLLPRPEARGDC